MKKFLIVLLVIVLVGGLVGGVAYMSKGFKDWNVKDWIKPSADITTPADQKPVEPVKPTVKSVALNGISYNLPNIKFSNDKTIQCSLSSINNNDYYNSIRFLPVIEMSDGSKYDMSNVKVNVKYTCDDPRTFFNLTSSSEVVYLDYCGYSLKSFDKESFFFKLDDEIIFRMSDYFSIGKFGNQIDVPLSLIDLLDNINYIKRPLYMGSGEAPAPNQNRITFFSELTNTLDKINNTNIEVIVEGVSYNFYCNLDYKA